MMDISTKFKTYPEYKDSGVEWLGEIPGSWSVEKLGSTLRPVSEKNHPDEQLLSITREQGVILRDIEDDSENHNFIPDDLSGYKLIKKGQFGMNKMKAWQGSYGVSDHTGIVSPAYFVFNFTKDVHPEFFHKAIRSKLYVSYFGSASDGVRIGQWDLSKSRMKQIPILLPPHDEQIAIANFLDDKVSKIDEAIAQKEQLIQLLNERKQIIIQNAVTKGLNPNAPMKDSGIEWIGEIPEHWEVKKAKFLGKIKYGLGQPPREKEDGLPLIRATNVERGQINTKGLIFVDPTDIPWERDPVLKENDIIVVRSGAYTGDSARIPKEYEGAITGYDMVYTPSKDMSKFLSYSLLSHYVLYDQLYLLRMRAAQPHLNAEELSETLFILPSATEQKSIVSHIETQSSQIALAITQAEQSIKNLKEYKASLINSAVTGKIKVS